ncbi:MAG: DUF1266 domain-containing protein [Agarilytica sp.]
MGLDSLSKKQKFALSLAAPVLIAEPGCDYQSLAFAAADKVAALLSSQWSIDNREQLLTKLDWLDTEGGYTIEYLRLHHYLSEMLHLERKDFIASLASGDAGQFTRASLVAQYLHDLGEHTIRAFDIAGQNVLVRAGYVMGWFEEAETWQRLTLQADIIVDHGMFKTHFDYLYSYVVGRVFGMMLDHEALMDTLTCIRDLVNDDDSPYVAFAPWPNTDGSSSAVGEGV